jgi:hypothetical protein
MFKGVLLLTIQGIVNEIFAISAFKIAISCNSGILHHCLSNRMLIHQIQKISP